MNFSEFSLVANDKSEKKFLAIIKITPISCPFHK